MPYIDVDIPEGYFRVIGSDHDRPLPSSLLAPDTDTLLIENSGDREENQDEYQHLLGEITGPQFAAISEMALVREATVAGLEPRFKPTGLQICAALQEKISGSGSLSLIERGLVAGIEESDDRILFDDENYRLLKLLTDKRSSTLDQREQIALRFVREALGAERAIRIAEETSRQLQRLPNPNVKDKRPVITIAEGVAHLTGTAQQLKASREQRLQIIRDNRVIVTQLFEPKDLFRVNFIGISNSGINAFTMQF